MPDDRIRRTLLFMPGDDLRKISKGARLDVDAVIMDLEDAVAPDQKDAARSITAGALTDASLDFGRTERLVRVNPASTGLQADDIAATVGGKPDGYVIPKVEDAQTLTHIDTVLSEHEQHLDIPDGSIRLLALIETALGVVNLREIASAHRRLVALIFGAEDLASSMGAIRTTDGHEGAYARSAVVLHAAAFGLQAIDTPYVDFKNTEGLAAETQRVMEMGYTGKLAIHPAQIELITGIFTPNSEAIERAQQLLSAWTSHKAAGRGVFAYDGKMVDMPMIRAAERIVARAHAAGIITEEA